jgi:hypothetical protein
MACAAPRPDRDCRHARRVAAHRRAAESARAHLSQTINAARCDVDIKTERKGRPYSLISMKNQASYDRRVAQRKKDLANISMIQN